MRIRLALGARDTPTDGVYDFAARLAEALSDIGLDTETLPVPWHVRGWDRALGSSLREDDLALLQYTHLAWSRRGFPIRALRAAAALRRTGARVGVVFHDPSPFEGRRVRDRVRAAVQRSVVRSLARRSALTFTTLEAGHAGVFDGIVPSPRFLPAGSNVPVTPHSLSDEEAFTISVFGITERNRSEASSVVEIVSRVAQEVPEVQLRVFGRGASDAEDVLRSGLQATALTIEGVLEPGDVSERLGSSQAMLFVRGAASSRRGTIVAAICNGVPVVAPEGNETGPAIHASGIGLFPAGDHAAAAALLVRLRIDGAYAQRQRARQRTACASTFSWSAIAARVVEAL